MQCIMVGGHLKICLQAWPMELCRACTRHTGKMTSQTVVQSDLAGHSHMLGRRKTESLREFWRYMAIRKAFKKPNGTLIFKSLRSDTSISPLLFYLSATALAQMLLYVRFLTYNYQYILFVCFTSVFKYVIGSVLYTRREGQQCLFLLHGVWLAAGCKNGTSPLTVQELLISPARKSRAEAAVCSSRKWLGDLKRKKEF